MVRSGGYGLKKKTKAVHGIVRANEAELYSRQSDVCLKERDKLCIEHESLLYSGGLAV